MISPLRWFSSLSRTLPTLAFFAFYIVSTGHAFAYTTTLGSGVDPSAVSIAPSASATSSDSFTLQTDYPGSNTINSVIVDLGSTLNALAISLIEITSDNGVTVYGSVANPSNATTSITLSGLAATSTSAQYKIRLTPKTHANMPPPNGQTYTVNAKVSDWTDANATTKAGSDTGGTTVTIDNQSPTLLPNTGATWRTGVSAADNSWYSVAYGKGIFVGVSYDGTNRIMTSTDGINWTARTSPEQNMLMDVTYGNGMFVAVAQDGTYQVITSTDGINWTGRTTAPGTAGNGWLGVAYGNGRFVAVSQSGTYRAMYSTNGTTWTASTAAAANAWKGLTYGNGLFVAVAQTGTASDIIMTSPDGVTWTPRTAPEANQWLDVTYGGGLFVAVAQSGTNRVMTSPDGITWTARSVPASSYYWDGVAYGNGLFVAASYGTSGIITSPDGITWTARTPSVANGWGAITYGNGLFVTLAGNGIGNRAMVSGTMMASTTPGDTMVTINYTTPADTDTNSIVVLRSSSYNDDVPVEGASYSVGNVIGASTVACVDTTISASTSDACTATGLANGTNYYFKIFAQDSNGNYSPGFTPPNLPSVPSPTTTIGDGTDPASATVAPGSGAVMADAFTVQSSSGSKGLSVVTVDLGSAEAASALSLVEITSDNGATVYGSTANPTNATTTISTAGINITTSLVQLKVRVTPKSHANMPAVPGGTYVVLAKVTAVSNPNNIVYYQDAAGTAITIDNQSLNAVASDVGTWTVATAASVTDWNSVTYGEGIFVAVACGVNATSCNTTAGTRVMTSSDGLNWTGRTAAADNQWQSVTYGNGLFVAVANSGTGNRVMTSPDGITWTSRTSSDNAWNSVTYGRGIFVAVAGSGTGNRVMTSPDGITWTSRTSAADNTWNSVTYGNGLFVAVSNSGTGNRVMTSPDGITWTARTNPVDAVWESVTYGNGLFVATGWSHVMTSPDGITWTDNSLPSGIANSWNSVTYGNGLFVSVSCAVSSFACNATGGSRIMTSPDGITWTPQGDPADTYQWNSVIFGNGIFAAVSTAATGNRVMASTTTVPTVAPGDAQAVLSYTTPGDSDLSSMVVLRSTSPVTNVPVEGTSYSVGNVIGTATVACIDSSVATSTSDTCTATGLSNGTAYYFKLFAKDASGNYSTGIAPAGLPVTPNVVVTLGDGTDPSSVTATPGGPAVMADAFTVQTSQGTKTISSVVVNLGSAAITSPSSPPMQTAYALTSGTSWTVPAGVTAIDVWSIGAGGGGAGSDAQDAVAGGAGGAGGVAYKSFSVTPGSVISYSIGSAGTGGTGASNGNSGGTTTITVNGVTLTGQGGKGGGYNTGQLGSGGTATGGSTNGSGGTGSGATGDTGGGGGGGLNGSNGTSNGASGGTGGTAADVQGLFSAVTSLGYSTTGAGQGGTSGSGNPNAMNGTAATGFGAGGGGAGFYGGNGGNGYFGGGGGGAAGYTSGQAGGSGGAGVIIISATSTNATSGIALIEITSDDGGVVYGSVANPTNPTTSITLSTNTLTASSTPVQYKIRITPKTHANMPAVPGDTYVITAKVDSVVAVNYVIAGTDTGGTKITIDNQSPTVAPSDGIAWISRQTPADNAWQSVTYGNGLFVAVSSSGTGNRVMTSPDGITWTARTSAADNAWQSVTYGNGLFVAVACGVNATSCNSTVGNRVMTSPDGITWTLRASADDTSLWKSVTYGNGLFVAVSCGSGAGYCNLNAGGSRIMTSPDGITWTSRTSPVNNEWLSVAYGNGLFVALTDYNGSTSNDYFITSQDGVTWTVVSLPGVYAYWTDVFYANGTFFATYSSIIATSTDGLSWNMGSWTGGTRPSGAYGNGIFLMVGSSAGSEVAVSPDAANWSTQYAAEGGWTSVTYGNGLFVAVAGTGVSGSRAMTSSSVANPTVSPLSGAATVSYSPEPNTQSVIVLRSTSPIADIPVEGATYSVGSIIGASTVACVDTSISATTTGSCSATGLSNGTSYYFKVFARDASGNYSSGMVPTGAPAKPNPSLVLGDGTDPSPVAIIPGSSAVMADSFTLQTSSGSDTVSSLVVNLGSTDNASSTKLVEIVSDNGVTVYGSSTNPTNATTSISLSLNTLTANTTLTQYKIRITPKAHAAMPVSPGDKYVINAKVDSISGNYVPSGSDNGGTTLTIDNQSPAPSVTDDTVWTSRASAADNAWTSVTYGNGLFVAVANSGAGNRVMTSPDGITWTARTSAADNAWQSVTYGNGLFVAVANSGAGNRVMTSPDGITWTARTIPIMNSWSDITYGNDLFLITSSSGYVFLYSQDGISWTTGKLPFIKNSFTYGNGLFIAVGGGGIMTSPDGITWTARTSAADNAWQSVTYGNGLFVAVANSGAGNRVMTSPDGITWTARTSAADNAWTSVTYGNGLFVAVSSSGTGNRVMTSPDGITWTARTSAADNAWQSVTYGNGLFVAVSSSGTGNRVMTSGSLNPVILPGYNQVTVSYTTPLDSDVESVVVLRSTSPITNVPADGSTYSVGNTIGTSTVGCVIAAPPSVPVSCDMTGLTNGATYYFKVFTKDLAGNYSIGATPDNGSTSPGTITQLGTGSDPASTTIAPGGSAVMADSFTLKTSSGTDVVTSMVVNLGSALAASSVSSIEIASDNGVTVYGSSTNPTNATTSISLSLNTLTANTTLTQYKIRITPKAHADMPSVPGAIYPVTATIGSFASTNSHAGSDTVGTTISIDNESPSDVSANDGLSWVSRNSQTLGWQSVAFGNGTFVAVGAGSVMTSPDGVTWTGRSPASGNTWTSVTYGNGLFVAVSSNGTGNRVMTSPNGITWTSRTSAANNYWTSVTYGNGLFVAVSCGVNSTFCNSTSGNRVMTSPDGITWTQRADAADYDWTSVTYGNGLFVAVSCSTSSSCGGSSISMISSDGITWTSSSLTYGSTWQSVTYGNGKFVAVADEPFQEAIITSTDGINWTLATSSVSTYLKSVTYGAGLFVAVSRSGTSKVLVSSDGSAWTAVGSAANYNWYGVTYGNGKFVAVAQNGSGGIGVMTSDSSETTVTPGNGQATVFYTIPSGIADLDSVVVLRSTSSITDTPVEGATYAVGNAIGSSTVACVDSTVVASSTGFCTATGLSNATPYYFQVFTKDTSGNYSSGITPGGSPVTPSVAAPLTQSGYRFFASSTSPTPGTAMAVQNTAATLSNANDAFRMRLTIHAGGTVALNSALFKLQYAQMYGTCDTSFVGEVYSDITTSSPISYYDVPGLSNNSFLTGGAGDITHNADTVVNESYVESNPFKNSQAALSVSQDGKFDFSLYDNGAPSNTPYCIRAVNFDGSPLQSYSVIPQITTATQQVQVASFRLRKDDGSDITATYSGSENGSLSNTYVVGDKLRIRFAISNTGSASTYKSYRLEYASSSCTAWIAVPRTIDVTNEHWKIETSPYVADYSSTNHSTGLTAPSGKTFVSGSIQTFNNTTQPIMLATNQYTEIEYSVRSTTNVAISTPYCFRVSPVGDPSAMTYVATPQVTPSARIFRYQGGGGGGGGGSQSASSSVEASASTATTTTTGGTTSGGAASSTESTATSTTQTSTSTPTQGGGSGDVGYLLKLNGNAYAFANGSVGIVLGDSAEKMCVDLKGVMMVGSRDQANEGQVAELQYFLQISGYFNSKVTGYFGKVTEKAVRQFQADKGLPVTGIVGKATRNKMKQVGCLLSWRTLFPRPSASISPNVEFANQ